MGGALTKDGLKKVAKSRESIPLFGVIPSALKAVIALAKIIIGLAIVVVGTPLFLSSYLICESIDCLKTFQKDWYAVGFFLGTTGFIQLFESLLNIETLGLERHRYFPLA